MKSTSKSEKTPKQVKAKGQPASTAKGEETKKGDVSDTFGRPAIATGTPEKVQKINPLL